MCYSRRHHDESSLINLAGRSGQVLALALRGCDDMQALKYHSNVLLIISTPTLPWSSSAFSATVS